MILMRAMMTSTSNRNVLKYSQDKKKKKSARYALVGHIAGGILAACWIAAQSYGMAYFGFADMVPALVATVLSLMAVVLTLFKSNGYLYSFKEYDMLMAMPFSVRCVVANRFLLMYIRSLPWDILISLSALVGYAIKVQPSVWVYVIWIVLTPFIPLLPTVLMSLIGVVIADIGSRFRFKKVVQTILVFAITIPLAFSGVIINSIAKNDQISDLMRVSSDAMAGVSRYVPTVSWFDKAVNHADILSLSLLIGLSVVAFVLLVLFMSATYRRINSRLEVSAARRGRARVSPVYKKKSVKQSIAFCEFKRMTGSTNCAVNMFFGSVIAIVAGVVLPFIGIEPLIRMMAKGKTFDLAPFRLVWPVLTYFFLGMSPTTVVSPSLEGKRYWILRSLPIDKMTIYKGKMLLNIYINLLPGLFVVTTGLISLKATWYEYILGLLMITAMCLFSTTRGLKCGLKHVNLEWENELDVIKRGAATTIYLLPNMFATLILMGVMGVVCYFVSGLIGAAVVIVVYGLLAFYNYLRIVDMAK